MFEERTEFGSGAVCLGRLVKVQVFGRDFPVLGDVPCGARGACFEALYNISSSQLTQKVQLEVDVREALPLYQG